ncbi:MAG: ATP-binding protein [Ktedonobacteraceae bacterium]
MRQLPTGTVTLLFTDIEGSTHLLQQLGEHYASVLVECRRLLRSTFQQWNGYEVDTQGDAFFVAFARATDAVSAVVAAQRALATHVWSAGVEVRMRMGLHTGEPSLFSEGYVGMDVHHAARIMSAGHGGQVLLSQTTRDIVEHHLPAGVSLRDMGEHHLKDLQRPSHLFQLVIAGLPADFPPLKTLDARPNNLPIQPAPLIGREKEVTTIERLLRRIDVRLVTLTGPGGIGKTRLALQAAAVLGGLFAHGVYFVDLAPINDPALVIPAIAQTLDLHEEGELLLPELLKEELRQKEMLLLLDNFEQVIGAAVQVANLLKACPQLKLVVTSRAALRIRAEREFVVPPLSLPNFKQLPTPSALLQNESVALFVQHTQAVKPDFQLTVANAPIMVEIIAHLDGLPLAIELAAARMKLLSPEALLARLSQRLQVLTGGARDVAARQQTLRNTIEWSYNLLDLQEQQLFRRLSIFVGGCTLEAVEATCAVPDAGAGSMLDILTSLLDKSLLQRKEQAAEPRFAMLETIREYGLEVLADSGEMEMVQKAYATYFLALAQRAARALSTPQEAAWMERLEQEHDNLRAVMQWSLEPVEDRRKIALHLGGVLRSFWSTRGYLSEGLDFLERALLRSDGVEASVRAKALYAAARLNEMRGDYDQAEPFIAESLALYQELGDIVNIAYALHLQADIAWGRGNLALARSQAEASLALLRELGDKGSIAYLLLHLGSLAADQGAYVMARSLLEESLAINRGLEDKSGIAESLFNLARVCFLSDGDRELVRALLEESITLYRTFDDKESIAYCLCLSGLLALDQGNTASARSLAEQGVALFKEMRQRHGTAFATALLAKVIAAQGDSAVARTLYEESIMLARRGGNKLNIASNLEGMASVVASQGKYVWAVRLWGAAEALREDINAPLPPIERTAYEQAVAAARDHLGEPAFAAAWGEGRTVTLDDALYSRDM